MSHSLVASEYDTTSVCSEGDSNGSTSMYIESEGNAMDESLCEGSDDSSSAHDSLVSCSVAPSPTSAVNACDCDADSEDSNEFQLRQGAGKGHRVTHNSVAEGALQKLIADLSLTPQGLVIEHQCARRILDTDSKATRAIFQAISPAQRAAAFAAALGRAGLNSYANGMLAAQRHFEAQATKQTEAGEESVTEQSCTADEQRDANTCPADQMPPLRKRGRPPGSSNTGCSSRPAATSLDIGLKNTEFDQTLGELAGRLALLERWAHGVDETLATYVRHQQVAPRDAPREASHNGSTTAAPQTAPPREDTVEHRLDVTSVPQRVADIEQAIRDQETQPPSSARHPHLADLECRVNSIGDQLALLKLRPVSEAFTGEDETAANELSLNWRLGMIEVSIATQSSEMIAIQHRVGELGKQPKDVAPPPPPPPAVPPL
eukprot:5874842-Amphidinium_carterae.3